MIRKLARRVKAAEMKFLRVEDISGQRQKLEVKQSFDIFKGVEGYYTDMNKIL